MVLSVSSFINIIIALLVFSTIIFIHELGHYLLAKKNDMIVSEFAVGMGPLLFSKTVKETKYSLRAIPMGGYCALGEDEESDDARSFVNKSVWARIAVIIAGPLFNFILAFVLSLILIAFCGYDAPTVYNVQKGSPAKTAGIQKGDVITHLNGGRVYNYREILDYMLMNQTGEELTLDLVRDGEKISYTIKPEKSANGTYLMGINFGGYVKADAINVIKYSVLELRYQVKRTFISLGYLVSGRAGVKDMSGPVGIVSMMSDTIDQAKESAGNDKGLAVINVVLNMINFAILLSANLGVMNLLPFPALDGGRTVLLLVEAIFKKIFPKNVEAAINLIGFVLLIGLMIVVMFQDVWKLFVK